ncbi:GNAT family N-acetyltransferase [Paenibacillus alginolyticus]|uniref:GNAT family N-acetyltransferase n=1 Tax=Paenibacillus alginolyticus TaxID=59839 RepID=UPI0004923394|nr:GNAT family N-acetyltransferase [Paenibacillus alginolyticus]MCY9664215.1 GNAT family N-acetyltransferase [Paenibacillus alginolyticus]
MYEIREMTINDYEMSIELWQRTEGMALSEADSKESINYYLNRNNGMSCVCVDKERVIGTILCGHDGRRGYIYHVAVDPEYRGKALGKKLVVSSLKKLKLEGICKCHIMVIAVNEIGNKFWGRTGWIRRDGILLYSSNT